MWDRNPVVTVPQEAAVPPYTFATITTEGLRCAGIPVWGTTTLTLAEGSTYHYNLHDQTRRLRITGIQPIKLAIVQVPTIPAGIQVSLSDQGILTITTPEIHDNTRSQIDVATPLILSATNTTTGITNTTTAAVRMSIYNCYGPWTTIRCDGDIRGQTWLVQRRNCGGTNTTRWVDCPKGCTNKQCDNVINGGWSDWSPWSPCTSNSQTRTCTNPVPQHGGAASTTPG